MAYTAALVRRGNRIPYTNNTGADIASKQVVVIRTGTTGQVGITIDTITSGSSGDLAVGGGDEAVWTLPKKAGDIFAFGDLAYWDPINKFLTTTTLNNARAGWTAVVPSTSATSMTIRL